MGKYDSILLHFNYSKDGFEFWYTELFEITVEYFEKHVLPLLSYMSYSEPEKINILTHGFRNILYQTEAERALRYDYGLLTSHVLKSLQRSPLDKTNIELKLFGAFLGFTSTAVKATMLIGDVIRIKENQAMNVWREMNELYQKSQFELYMTKKQLKDRVIKNKKEKVGAKLKYKTESELQSAIMKVSGWEKLPISKISKAIGFGKNRLSQLLKEKDWDLPKKN